MIAQSEIRIATRGRGTYDFTQDVQEAVRASGVSTGLCHLFIRHTSASMMLCENADPAVRSDLETRNAEVRRLQGELTRSTAMMADMQASLAQIRQTGEANSNLTKMLLAEASDLRGREADLSKQNVELQQTGVINGDVTAGSLSVVAGARMRGRAEFGWNETGSPRPVERRQP